MGIASIAVRDFFHNTAHNIQIAPTYVELMVSASKMRRAREAAERKENKKVNEELKKAKKEGLFNSESSESVVEHAAKTESDIIKAQMIGRSVESNKWIGYTLYYMSNPEAKLVQADAETCKFVNTIGQYFGFGKIYESAEIGDIKDYDVSTEGTDKFLICIDDLSVKMQDEALMSKILSRKNAMNNAKTEETPVTTEAEKTEETSEATEEAVKIPNFVKEEKEVIEIDQDFVNAPLHDTGSKWYVFLSFLLPLLGLIAGPIFRKKNYIRNFKACRKRPFSPEEISL